MAEAKTRFLSTRIGQTVGGHECDNCNFTITEISTLDYEIGLHGDWSGGTNPYTACNDMVGVDDVWLNLKHLSKITDNEAIELGKILAPVNTIFQVTRNERTITIYCDHEGSCEEGVQIIIYPNSTYSDYFKSSHYITDKVFYAYQYLIANGYALDYYCPVHKHVLNVDKQIEFGWVKIV